MIPNRPAALLIFPTVTPLPKHSRWLRRTALFPHPAVHARPDEDTLLLSVNH